MRNKSEGKPLITDNCMPCLLPFALYKNWYPLEMVASGGSDQGDSFYKNVYLRRRWTSVISDVPRASSEHLNSIVASLVPFVFA